MFVVASAVVGAYGVKAGRETKWNFLAAFEYFSHARQFADAQAASPLPGAEVECVVLSFGEMGDFLILHHVNSKTGKVDHFERLRKRG